MNKHDFHLDVTYVALENFVEKSFEIAFDVFYAMQESQDSYMQEFFALVGHEEIYESLMYHKEIVHSILLTKNYELIESFFVWKYSMYSSRGVDVDCFLVEYALWKQSVMRALYQSHSAEINLFYDYLLAHHAAFKELSSVQKEIAVNQQHKALFDRLAISFFEGKKEEFYEIAQENLHFFGGDIFVFIQQILNPLMYQVGKMWQYNKISVAKEHLATSLTNEIVDLFLVQSKKSQEKKPRALISTVGDESHNLGIKIVGKFLDSCGFDVKNLGAKLSQKELLASVYELRPELLVLSVTLPSNLANLQRVVHELKSDANVFAGLIVVGGQALFGDGAMRTIEGADFCSNNLEELRLFLEASAIK